MIRSMTAFASARGEHESYSWAWELRSVNGKGLDLRLRVPDWLEGLEAALRAELTKSVVRGNVTLTLRLTRSEQTGALVRGFLKMRGEEGAALARILGDQLDMVAALTADAAALAEARKDAMAETLRANLARVLDQAQGADPDRVAQELALIAVKSDVREEIDRLGAHVGAARALLDSGGAVGRKLDFLMQEFNREANTLCSKAQDSDLTAVGLDLKAVIDQMREQVQNIE